MGKHVGHMYAQTRRDESQANLEAMSGLLSDILNARGMGKHTKRVKRKERKRRHDALNAHIRSFMDYVG
jgi:hypothetical protein